MANKLMLACAILLLSSPLLLYGETVNLAVGESKSMPVSNVMHTSTDPDGIVTLEIKSDSSVQFTALKQGETKALLTIGDGTLNVVSVVVGEAATAKAPSFAKATAGKSSDKPASAKPSKPKKKKAVLDVIPPSDAPDSELSSALNSEIRIPHSEISIPSPINEKLMIQIDVFVFEIATGHVQELGIDWPSILTHSTVPGQTGAAGTDTPLHVSETNPPLVQWGTIQRGGLDVAINALVTKGYANVIAKPKLLAANGTKAKFISGGKVSVVSQGTLGGSNVGYETYGITLEIEPTADAEGNIFAKVRAEVSSLDPSTSVRLGNGTSTPSFTTRSVENQVYVKAGHGIMMAGLIQEKEIVITSGVPLLSDIPFFGEILKSHHTEISKTELVFNITPRVVQ